MGAWFCCLRPAGDRLLDRRVGWPSVPAELTAAIAAIGYLGMRGVQIVLTNAEKLTLMIADKVDDTLAACAQAGVTVDNGWVRELAELARPGNDLWRSGSWCVMDAEQPCRHGRQRRPDRDMTMTSVWPGWPSTAGGVPP